MPSETRGTLNFSIRSRGIQMNITVIGAGNMGSAFVKQLHAAGHSVKVTARSQDKADKLAAAYPGVKSVHHHLALQSLGDLQGKVVVDITNPLTADYMGLTLGYSTSAAEEIAKAVPGAQIVKGFNTLFAQVLAGGADFGNGQKASVFLASDHAAAKQTVTQLAQSLGFGVVDAGGLKNARYLEPLAGLNIYLGYGAGLGTAMAPVWIHKA